MDQVCDLTADIKSMLGEGDILRANEALGYPYFLRGVVVHGKAVGRSMGAPTANLLVPENSFLPKFGVYATVSEVCGRLYMGVTNIGVRPTVDDNPAPTIETVLLDFDGDIYGETVILRLYSYLRGLVKFGTYEELAAQIEKDKSAARAFLTREEPLSEYGKLPGVRGS